EMYEVAKKLCSFCEGLVHDEHLQHQGWAAIMANLEDCSNSYQKLLFKFESIYSNYLQSIEDIKLKLTHLGTAVSVMAKIPLLECLTRHSYRECLGRLDSLNELEGSEKAEMKQSSELVLSPDMPRTTDTSLLTSFHKSVEHVAPDSTDAESGKEIRESNQSTAPQDETSVDAKDSDLPFFNVSLLDWINVQDRPNDVESLVRKCFDSMSRLDPKIIRPFIVECHQTIAKLDNQNMKAIKGLEDRLYALDQMIASCGRLVNEQKELAQGFLANQMRAENLKDASVLPDLCLSHANQLMIMLQNHRKLLDIKQKCTTAKQELANNLHVRLKVPLLCDFEPLHQHVLALHNLVKAAQSLDEMSQTITDLLNEQKASMSQASPQLASSPRTENAAGTNFNTVLTREKMRKENIINDLNDKLKSTMQQQERDKDLIESLSEDRARLLEEKKKLEEEVSKLRSSTFVSSPYVTAAPELYGACAPGSPSEADRSALETADEGKVDSAMETSMMSVQENVHMLSEEKQRIMLLERTLQLKEEENKRLNQRLVGDLVLIILDERHDNYVLFTVSPTLYFLHSESLPALDLKPGEGASGASRRPWVLGKVMEKEYCQAKKAQNRFKVPLGTKFYRVKAVSWNKKV
ncbi:RB1-inducible coiled-coil protein 1, partial [Heterocephalus glaber]